MLVATREGGVDRNETGEQFRGEGRIATREGGVDRNSAHACNTGQARVATREGGVDRNSEWRRVDAQKSDVATREGGVDRNICHAGDASGPDRSPPARVAWIETLLYIKSCRNATGRHPRGWRG